MGITATRHLLDFSPQLCQPVHERCKAFRIFLLQPLTQEPGKRRAAAACRHSQQQIATLHARWHLKIRDLRLRSSIDQRPQRPRFCGGLPIDCWHICRAENQ